MEQQYICNPGGVTLAIMLSLSSDQSQVSVIAITSDLLLLMKSVKATDLFLMDLILIRLPVKRLVLGPGFILTSPDRINNMDTQGLTCLKECVTLLICPFIAKKA